MKTQGFSTVLNTIDRSLNLDKKSQTFYKGYLFRFKNAYLSPQLLIIKKYAAFFFATSFSLLYVYFKWKKAPLSFDKLKKLPSNYFIYFIHNLIFGNQVNTQSSTASQMSKDLNDQQPIKFEQKLVPIKEIFSNSFTQQILKEQTPLLNQQKASFESLLKQMEQKAKKILFVNEKALFNEFNMASILAQFSIDERRVKKETLQITFNQLYLHCQILYKSQYMRIEAIEKKLILKLGYSITHLDDKKQLFICFKETLQKQLKIDHFKLSQRQFKQIIKQCALHSRLNKIGIKTKLQVDKFHAIYSILMDKKNELAKYSATILLPYKINQKMKFLEKPKFWQSKKLLIEEFDQFKKFKSNQLLLKILNHSDLAIHFKNDQLNLNQLTKFIHKQIKANDLNKYEMDCLNVKLNDLPKVKFYFLIKDILQCEMPQGYLRSDEVLGDGLCLGLCFRILSQCQHNQLLDVTELLEKISTLNSKDRYFQAFYELNASLIQLNYKRKNDHLKSEAKKEMEQSINFIPHRLLKKNAFKEHRDLFNVEYDPQKLNLEKKFKKHLAELITSNGWGLINLSSDDQAHTTLIRFDSVQKYLWFFDPNIGLLCFEKATLLIQDMLNQFFNFLKALIKNFYPSTNQVNLQQLL